MRPDRTIKFTLHHYRPPPRCKSDLRSSGMLRSVDWQLVIEVSGQHIGPIGYSETSVTNYQTTLRDIIEERRSRFTFSAQNFLSLWLAAHEQKLSVEPSVNEQNTGVLISP